MKKVKLKSLPVAAGGQVEDCNNVQQNGVYQCLNSVINKPDSVTGGILVVFDEGMDRRAAQLYFASNEGVNRLFFRTQSYQTGSVWQPWKEL